MASKSLFPKTGCVLRAVRDLNPCISKGDVFVFLCINGTSPSVSLKTPSKVVTLSIQMFKEAFAW